MPRLWGLALVVLIAAAPAPAAEEQGQTLPAWIEKPLEAANPYVGAGSDLYGGASGAIEASKVKRASDFALEEGNRAVRRAQAMEYNLARTTAKGYVDAVERFKLGTATTVADVGGTLAAHVLEGDYRSVPGVVANAAAKNAVTSGGAWAVGTAGAAAGSVFGPVGTLVGGAVGAGLGALGSSWGYDAAGEALKANGYKDVQGYVDALLSEDERAAFRQAQQNRREWLVEHGLPPVVGGDPGFVKPPPGPASAEPPRPEASAAPAIIPDDCTIEVVLWNKANPAGKWHGTFRVSGDTVTGRGEFRLPPESGPSHRRSALHSVDDFAGTRNDNVFKGTTRGKLLPMQQESWSAPDGSGRTHHCTMTWSNTSVTQDELTLLPGGTGRFSAHGTLTTHTQLAGDCGESVPGTETSRIDVGGDEIVITWKVQ